jgi:hypothetical protein
MYIYFVGSFDRQTYFNFIRGCSRHFLAHKMCQDVMKNLPHPFHLCPPSTYFALTHLGYHFRPSSSLQRLRVFFVFAFGSRRCAYTQRRAKHTRAPTDNRYNFCTKQTLALQRHLYRGIERKKLR